MRKMVLTGGACSGKTTLVNELKRRGYNVLEEVARQVLEELGTPSNLDEWADNHPGSREGKDPHGSEYIDLVAEATGGDVIEDHEIKTNMKKIVKGIAKNVKLNVDNSGNMVE